MMGGLNAFDVLADSRAGESTEGGCRQATFEMSCLGEASGRYLIHVFLGSAWHP